MKLTNVCFCAGAGYCHAKCGPSKSGPPGPLLSTKTSWPLSPLLATKTGPLGPLLAAKSGPPIPLLVVKSGPRGPVLVPKVVEVDPE